MIIYFSAGGTTRKYAEQLGVLIKDSVFELKEAKSHGKPLALAGWGAKSLLKMRSVAERLPDISHDRIVYICSPVFAGNIPPVVRYFIENSNLEGKKINLILTCSMISNAEKYKKNAINNLVNSKCRVGFAHVFTSAKNGADDEIISEHLREIVMSVDKSF